MNGVFNIWLALARGGAVGPVALGTRRRVRFRARCLATQAPSAAAHRLWGKTLALFLDCHAMVFCVTRVCQRVDLMSYEYLSFHGFAIAALRCATRETRSWKSRRRGIGCKIEFRGGRTGGRWIHVLRKKRNLKAGNMIR